MRFFLCLLIASLVCVAQQPSAESQRNSIAEKMAASLNQQRTSVQRQLHGATSAGGSGFFVLASSPAPASEPESTMDCDRLPDMRAQRLFETAARKRGVSTHLLRAVAEQESAFHPCAVSPKGALGLMQLMPATVEQFGVEDPFDPEENLDAGASLLKQLIDRYSGDLNRVLGAYNAGPARVDAANGIPRIPETIQYVRSILGKLPPP